MTFTVNSPTKITATVPNGASSGKISVTTPVGIAMGSQTFTVTPSDSLPLTIIAQTSTTITLGWTPVAGAGYELWIDNVRQKSFSRDPDKSSWKISKLSGGPHKYEVRAVKYGNSGSVTL